MAVNSAARPRLLRQLYSPTFAFETFTRDLCLLTQTTPRQGRRLGFVGFEGFQLLFQEDLDAVGSPNRDPRTEEVRVLGPDRLRTGPMPRPAPANPPRPGRVSAAWLLPQRGHTNPEGSVE